MKLTRARLEQLVSDLSDKTRRTAMMALEAAGIKANEVNQLLLVAPPAILIQ